MKTVDLARSWSPRALWHSFRCRIGMHRVDLPFVTMRWTCKDCGRKWDGIDAWGNPRNEIKSDAPVPQEGAR